MTGLRDMTVDELIARNAAEHADSLALEYEDCSFTWKELDIITDHIASHMLHDGIGMNTHVAILSTNSPNWISVYIALAKLGAVSVLINFNSSFEELRYLLDYTESEYLLYGDGYKDEVFSDIVSELKADSSVKVRGYMHIGRDGRGEWFRLSNIPYLHAGSYEELMAKKSAVMSENILSMVMTSGTDAEPKGVLLTHFQMLNIAAEAAEAMHWNAEDRICLSLSLFHCFGLSTGLLAGIVTGCELCLLSSFRSKQVLHAVQEKRCTVLNGVPSMFLLLLNNPDFEKYDISSLRSGIIAGSGIRTKDYLKICERMHLGHLQQSYGQTECSPSITFSDYDDSKELKSESVGRVIDNVEIRIADPDTDRKLENGQSGEIEVRGFNVMRYGYYRLRDLTEKTFSSDGWLRTGDIGYMDDNGDLYVTGRSKDIIIKCGENISPKEIEEVMLDYEGMDDVKVFGIEADIVQEEVAACFTGRKAIDTDGLMKYMRSRMAAIKMPGYLFRFDAFPLKQNGKLDINKMKEIVLGELKKNGGCLHEIHTGAKTY